jgi:hypothetical protein
VTQLPSCRHKFKVIIIQQKSPKKRNQKENKQTMKKILALALPLLLTVLSARAEVIYQDVFSYSNGPIADVSTNIIGGVLVTNWFTHSGNDDDFVTNHQLQVSSTTAYLGVTATRSGDVHRNFSITNNSYFTNVQQVLYASFMVTFTNLPLTNGAGSYFAHFYYSGTVFAGKLWGTQGNPGAAAPANFSGIPGTFRLGVAQGGTSSTFVNKVYPVDLALNTSYQVVMGFNPTAGASSDGNLPFSDTITLWINPISPSDPNVISSDAFTVPANAANAFAFRQASNFGGFVNVSNLVLSTTFPEAATNVLATNAVAPAIVYQPAAITTNFQNIATTLSAVVNGQGLGSLTYQWQESSSPANTSPVNVSNPNGNSSVLSVDSSTIGTGYYTLVATTPWALSTTSSVAKVAIIAPMGPPSFVTQPVSQTAYSGASVTLSTSVLSPGTPAYTWYSNNVVVTAGQQDSGLSSFYVIGGVSPASSATYKVAVTNNTSAIGIVSTNAVLTVANPQAVSIAYLRTLVDPTAFQATNVPPTIAYQVTGVVTTLTNITSGNTASYYLQDGTAGINIFVTSTSASTFRPAQGDSVTFVGVLSSFSSGLELYADTNNFPYTSYTINSSGNSLPTPRLIPFTVTNVYGFTYLNTNLAGSVVTITNVYFGTNYGNTISTTANQTVTVTNSSGTPFHIFFAFVDQDTAGQTMTNYASSVTGILYATSTNVIAVTKFSDIVSTISVTPIPLTTAYLSGSLTFNWSDASFDLQSSTNVVGPYVTIPGAGPGFVTNTASAPTMFFRLHHP